MADRKPDIKEVPDIIINPLNGKRYAKVGYIYYFEY